MAVSVTGEVDVVAVDLVGRAFSNKKNPGKVSRKIHKAEREKLKHDHLNELFVELGNALENKAVAVKQIWVECDSGGEWLLNLRRINCDVQVQEVAELLLCLDQMASDPSNDDSMVWGEKNAVKYRVKPGYDWWKRDSPGITSMVPKNPKIWQWRISLKVKIFLWLVFQQRVLTKSYRSKWRPHMDTSCEFCAANTETVERLFCSCPVLLQLWNLISVATSSRVCIKNMEDL
ncbi:Transcription factor bHLH47 [Acorus gramineus]|uniref:Transcription factor bHLH47 n=1 Tax=Acorus gramineus TaxID=55184 RepID=A0AAV9B964_ACOGR|nr:Transcription factor bHLH47 [Acorus gramineus]